MKQFEIKTVDEFLNFINNSDYLSIYTINNRETKKIEKVDSDSTGVYYLWSNKFISCSIDDGSCVVLNPTDGLSIHFTRQDHTECGNYLCSGDDPIISLWTNGFINVSVDRKQIDHARKDGEQNDRRKYGNYNSFKYL